MGVRLELILSPITIMAIRRTGHSFPYKFPGWCYDIFDSNWRNSFRAREIFASNMLVPITSIVAPA